MPVFIIETEKMRHNICAVRQYAKGREIIAVLKNDAYGLGLPMMARLLHEAAIQFFAVSQATDALLLRSLYPKAKILMLNPVQNEKTLLSLLYNDIILSVSSLENAGFIQNLCGLCRLEAQVHLEVDTGMGRFGLIDTDIQAISRIYTDFPLLHPTGIFTHLYSCCNKRGSTQRQLSSFQSVLSALRQRGIHPGTSHAANSAALFLQATPPLDAVRVGSAFTGRICGKAHPALQKVGYIRSEICEIKTFPKGRTIGYGGVYKTRRSTRAAIVPIGYGCGLHMTKAQDAYRPIDALRHAVAALRCLLPSRRLNVTIGNRLLPVIGRIGMGHIIVDLKHHPYTLGEPVSIDSNLLLSGRLMQRDYI
ncbi:MAG: alanine racemase [Christensenellales bacterium]|jgi:alanine racemase